MYDFKKIRYKRERWLDPGEEQIWLDGNHEDFETVKKKYTWLADNTDYPKRGMHDEVELKEFYDNVKLFIKKNTITSALDIGCGKGGFCNVLKNYCSTVHGLDFAFKPDEKSINKGINFINGNAHEIPLPDKCVDLVTSFDFLEHVHPDYLDKTIEEMFRVGCKYMIHRIAGAPSRCYHDRVGQLHIIQEKYEPFWKKQVFKPHVKDLRQIGYIPYDNYCKESDIPEGPYGPANFNVMERKGGLLIFLNDSV